MKAIAEAYGITSYIIDNWEFEKVLAEILNTEGPILCEVVLDQDQIFEPKLSSKKLEDGTMISASLEDMFPFLDREELKQNMLTPEYARNKND